jgi:hypothetical protein
MKLLALLALSTFLSFTTFSQDTDPKIINDVNAEPRRVGSFHAIKVEDGIDLYLTQGDEETVVVSANKIEYRNKINTRVENGVLRIYFGDERGLVITWRDRRLRAYISVKKIDALQASGGSDVIVRGTLAADKLKLDFSGGSDFVGTIKANELTVDISGGSDARINGNAVNLKIEASGGSDFKGYDLVSDYAIVEASGGSDAQLTVNKELFAEASGGSDIYFKGNPSVKRSSSSGGSSVSRKN